MVYTNLPNHGKDVRFSLCLGVLRVVIREYHFEAAQASTFASFEDDSIFNCQLIAIVPEFTQLVWYFLDCVWPTSEDDLAQTANFRISCSFVFDLTLLG